MAASPNCPILVFQMAKVASRSWRNMLIERFPEQRVSHFHYISEARTSFIESIMGEAGPNQTIRYKTWPRLGLPPTEIEDCIVAGEWVGPPALIVAGMRDPIARAVSVVGFFSNYLGYTRLGVTARDGGSPENLRALFDRVLQVARGASDDGDTLVRMLASMVRDYRSWFQDDLSAGFGFDFQSASFDRERRIMLLNGSHRAMIFRVEDLTAPETESILVRSAEGFFGRALGQVPPERVSGESRYRKIYQEFAPRVRLNRDDVDWFYDHDVVRMFYNSAEINKFRQRWTLAS